MEALLADCVQCDREAAAKTERRLIRTLSPLLRVSEQELALRRLSAPFADRRPGWKPAHYLWEFLPIGSEVSGNWIEPRLAGESVVLLLFEGLTTDALCFECEATKLTKVLPELRTAFLDFYIMNAEKLRWVYISCHERWEFGVDFH